MVAVVFGSGLGLFNGSQNILGGRGTWGQGVLGQAGNRLSVNAANGNLVLQARDEQLSGRGLDLLHLRTYNAKGAWNDGDGDGWRWDAERTVVFIGNGKRIGESGTKVVRTGGDGHQTEYTWDTSRQRYVSTDGDGAHDTLVYEEGPRQWVWVDGSSRQEERYTGSTGRLASQKDSSGNVIGYGYDGSGRLHQITDLGSGQKLVLTYAPVQPGSTLVRLQKVETSIQGVLLKQVEYGYDSLGRLTSVSTDLTPADSSDSRVYVTSYTYDDSNRITSVSQSDGSHASFRYDDQDRVIEVNDASGRQTFSYADAGMTHVTDAQGRVWTYVYDAAQQLIEVRAPASAEGGVGAKTQFHYDAQGNLARVTDARGHALVYGYDANGNRTLERDALGNTVTRVYNGDNQLVAETRYVQPDADGEGEQTPGDAQTTRYVYDAQSRLRFIVSADGRVSEHRYGTAANGYGLLTHSLRYTARRYDVGALAPTEVLSETALSAWVAAAQHDKRQVEQTRYDYDLRGDLSRRTDFATSNADGVGVLDAAASVTEYVYSGHGELLQTIVVRGSARNQRTTLSSTVYDGMGRELQTIDGSGTRTTVYDDANRRIQVTTGAGLVIVENFDTVGRLVSTTHSDGSTSRLTRYVYDPVGRLRMVEDAQGGRRFSFYDATGRLQHQVDSTGAVTGYSYDADGRLTAETRYAAAASGMAGWVDPVSGAVSKQALSVGGHGSDVVVDAGRDRLSTYAYDEAGRLVRRTETGQDGSGTLVTETGYDGTSRVTMHKAAERTTRYFYDRDGLQVGVIDALGFLTEYKYDAAGRRTETLRYSTPSAGSDGAAGPVWTGVSDHMVPGGRAFEYRLPPAYDPAGGRLSFSIVGSLPSWLSFDAAALILKGTPPAGVAGHPITLRASDRHGVHTDVTFQLTVGNAAPSWGSLPDSVVAAHTTGYSLVLPSAGDAEGAPLTYSIVDANLLPPGLRFVADPLPRLVGDPAPTTAGSYVVTLRVSDGQLSTERSLTIQVTNNGPRWNGVPNQGAWINTPFSLTLPPAVDPEGQALTYRVISKPAWLNFNAGVLSGTPPALGWQTAVVLEARDPFGETVRLSFSIQVGNRPTTWAPLSDPPPAPAGYPYLYAPPLAVDPDQQTLTYSLIGALPPGLSFNPSNGRISGTTNTIGTFALTMRVTDPHGEFIERSVTLRLVNAAPVYVGGLDGLPPLLGTYDFVINLAGAFNDPNGDALSYGFVVHSHGGGGWPSWLHWDAATKQFFGRAPQVTQVQTLTIHVIASDGYANAHRIFSVEHRPTSNGNPGHPPPTPGPVHPRFADPAAGAGKAPTVPAQTANATADVLAAWRPSSTDGLVRRHYYDGQGRVVGSVDERGFLSETVYDEQTNKQRTVRYLDWVVASASDTLDTLKARAGARQQVSTTEYDAMGRVSKHIGVDGTVSRHEYDSAGRLVRLIQAEGTSEQRASRTRYNAFGEITGTVGGVGDAALANTDAAIAAYGMRHEYDSLGRRIKSTDANGHATWFYYDGESRLTHSVNARGEVSQTVYNRFGQAESTRRYARVLDVDIPGHELRGGEATASFLALLAAIADPARDQVVQYEYDRRGQLVRQTDAEGFVTTNSYTVHGQLATQTRAIAADRSVTTRFEYDLRGQLATRTGDIGGLNFSHRLQYDAYGRVIESIDGAGKITSTAYKDSGRSIEITDALGRMSRSVYDAFDRVLTRTDAQGRATTFSYDDTTRSTRVTTPEGIRVTTTRTRHGQTLSVTDGRGATTQYAYDKDGQLKTVTDALGRVTAAHNYDPSGLLTQTTDARGVVTRYEYDKADRVIVRAVDPEGLNLRTAYAFDGLGQQILVTEGWGSSAALTTRYEYDRKGQLTSVEVDPQSLKLSTRYHFDGLGNQVRVERGTPNEPRQQVTLYEFDALGRRVKEVQAPSAVFGAGSARERDLTTEYRYDAAGRVSRVIDARGQSTWYVHDAAGQQTHVINAEGEVLQRWYDGNGQLVQTRQYATRLDAAALASQGDGVDTVSVTASAADRRSRMVYDADGRQRFSLHAVNASQWVVSESLHDANDNVIETRRYDKFLDAARLDALDTPASPALDVAELQAELTALGYGAEDTLSQLQRTRFAYDANNRLRFTVDALGRVSETVYDAGGLPRTSVRHATPVVLTDHAESAIAAAVNGGHSRNQITHYAYDSAGRLRYTVQVLATDRHLVSRQQVDALGRVVATTVYATAVGALADHESATLDAAIISSAQDRRSVFGYDRAGRQVLSAQLLADDQYVVRQQEYDAVGRLVKATAYATVWAAFVAPPASAQDRTTQFVYDAAGRQRYVINADGSLQETVYDALGQVSERRWFDLQLDAQSERTLGALDARRAHRRVGDGATRGESYTYDRVGRVTTTTDALGFTEHFGYDALGSRTSVTHKNGQVTRFVHDAVGRQVFAVQVLSSQQQLVSKQEYDAFGQLVHSIGFATPAGALSDYSLAGLSAAVVASAQDRRSAYAYDTTGRQVYSVQRLAPDQHLVSHRDYDSFGQVVKTTAYATVVTALSGYSRHELAAAVRTSAQDRTTTFAYDTLGRQRFAIAADGSVGETLYDALGRVTQRRRFDAIPTAGTAPTEQALADWRGARAVGDGVTRGETYSHDALDRLLSTTDAHGFVETSAYNAFGDRVSFTNKNNHTWTTSYDALGRMQSQTAPAVRVQLSNESAPSWRALETRIEYDAFGSVVQRREAFGTVDERTTRYAYDSLGRVTQTTAPGWYDPANGRVERHEAAGRFQRTVDLSYDALGNEVRSRTRTGPGANDFATRHKTYDALGRLVHDIDALNHVTTFGYTRFGEQHTVTRHSLALAGAPAQGPHWSIDEVASRLGGDARARTITTHYDNLGRKTEVTQPTLTGSYHDSGSTPATNAASITPTAGAAKTRYEYNSFGEVHRERVQIDASRWRDSWSYHDVMGRETHRIDALGHHSTHHYDALGNLIETVEYAVAGDPGASGSFAPPAVPAPDSRDRITAFVYNALDQQISIQRKGLSYSRWDEASGRYVGVHTARDVATTVQTTTYDGLGQVLTRTDGHGQTTTTAYNALGQVTQVTEPARKVGAAQTVDPFRNPVMGSPVTTMAHDAFGNVVRRERSAANGDPAGTIVTSQTYDHAGHAVTSTDGNGHVRQRRYDPAGRLTAETTRVSSNLGNWRTSDHTLERRYVYDANGRQAGVLDVYLEYGAYRVHGQSSVFNAFGEVEHELRVWGNAESAPSDLSRARTASYEYDRAGQVLVKRAADGETRYYYDYTGQVTRQEQRGDGAAGTPRRVTETFYDLLGRATLQRLPSFSAIRSARGDHAEAITAYTTQSHDRWGNVLVRSSGGYVLDSNAQVVTGAQTFTHYTYNADNQVLSERLPGTTARRADGSTYQARVTHELRYDLLGRTVQERDVADDAATAADEALLLRERNRWFDAAGQLEAQTDATGIRTEYAYDGAGNRIGTRNALGHVTVEAFDKNGNVTSRSVLRQADGTTAYDSRNGAQTAVARKLNEYLYDQANRRIGSADVMDTQTAYWSYTALDERGLVLATRNASGIAVGYAYDALGHRTTEVDANGNSRAWQYRIEPNADYVIGRLVSSTVGANRTTSYEHDSFGQVRRESYNFQSGERRFEYHANGLLHKITDENERGTAGMIGGLDHSRTVETVEYGYTVKGERARESTVNEHWFDEGVYQRDPGEPGTPPRETLIDIRTGHTTTSRVAHISYDARGRIDTIDASGGAGQNRSVVDALRYHYDELGNRRSIEASYRLSPSQATQTSSKWFTYDAEGRMRQVDGQLLDGQIQGGTRITYDALGRRQTAYVWIGESSGFDGDLQRNVAWQEYREERYSYNDLNLLTTIEQKLHREGRNTDTGAAVPAESTPWKVTQTHAHDTRGNVVASTRYSDMKFVGVGSGAISFPVHLTTTITDYRPDGQVSQTRTTDVRDATKSSVVNNVYDDAGVLTSYTYRQGILTSEAFTNTYTITHTTEFGGYLEKVVQVATTRPGFTTAFTTNQYDGRGRLVSQSVREGSRLTSRSFTHDGDGRILTKTEQTGTVGGVPGSSRQQDYVYVGGHEVASIGTLAPSTFSNGYTPISAAYPSSTPGSYIVSAGDTLGSIAQAVFGDRQLWYLIAEANSLSVGPDEALASTELGKSYRIPNVVSNVHHNDGTFRPYNPASIIGNTTPSPALPVPPSAQCSAAGQLLATAVIVAIGAAASFYTGGLAGAVLGKGLLATVVGGALAGAVGSAAGQVAGMAMGVQDKFRTDSVLAGGLSGGLSGFARGAVAAQEAAGIYSSWSSPVLERGVQIAQQELFGQVANGLSGIKSEGNGWLGSLGARLAVNASAGGAFNQLNGSTLKWGDAFEGLANRAVDPQSGWLASPHPVTWKTLANDAVGAFTQVGASSALAGWAEREMRARSAPAGRAHPTQISAVFGPGGQAPVPLQTAVHMRTHDIHNEETDWSRDDWTPADRASAVMSGDMEVINVEARWTPADAAGYEFFARNFGAWDAALAMAAATARTDAKDPARMSAQDRQLAEWTRGPVPMENFIRKPPEWRLGFRDERIPTKDWTGGPLRTEYFRPAAIDAAARGDYEMAELNENYMCPSCHIPVNTYDGQSFSIGAYEAAYRRNYATGQAMLAGAALSIAAPTAATVLGGWELGTGLGEAATGRKSFNPYDVFTMEFDLGRELSTGERIGSGINGLLGVVELYGATRDISLPDVSPHSGTQKLLPPGLFERTNRLSRSDLGPQFEEGANKTAHDYEDMVVLLGKPDISDDEFKRILVTELKALKTARALGLPVVEAKRIAVELNDGKLVPALLVDRKYVVDSKNLIAKPGDYTSLLTPRFADDITAIRRLVNQKGIDVVDAQFLIAPDGSLILADPVRVSQEKSGGIEILTALDDLMNIYQAKRNGTLNPNVSK